ncbi:hypothetical protein MVES1_003524 [Malassezia vespertilionis]|uniref:START domain-containing protein n=1 Tax=Malassezia vespertilionis TaxID=2020962 RepID=A0A2N1J6X9_9BASI|nr:uncharacterized protein MVES1_003524 [Malassezia vespertilionis]PKI82313.1 hypothetical protein MVES_003763 [Malassezia vespertilionis]WFD08154.1 hypothetical protein MVES1_003524 [Malassezia vespertilionis]
MESDNLVKQARSVPLEWQHALQDAIDRFAELHTDTDQAKKWRSIALPNDTPEHAEKGEPRVALAVLRRGMQNTDVYRVVWEHAWEQEAPLCLFRAVMQVQNSVAAWLPGVEGADIVDVLSPHAQIVRMRFRASWPSSARDAVLLTHVGEDDETFMYVATSVPTAKDSSPYMQHAPPYIRAHIHLMAILARRTSSTRLCTTVYWSWDVPGKRMGFGTNVLLANLPRTVPALVTYARDNGCNLPFLATYGAGIEMIGEDQTRECALRLTYAVGNAAPPLDATPAFGADPHSPKRSVTIQLAAVYNWDVQLEADTGGDADAAWNATLVRNCVYHTLCIEHDATSVRFTLGVRYTGKGGSVQVNGRALDAAPAAAPTHQRNAFLARMMPQSTMSPASCVSDVETSSLSECLPPPMVYAASSTPLGTLVRRNYIYFASLLQEPEAKWKRTFDVRGVTVTQLDSIDPTLVVYRAEATFIGFSVWDFLSTISQPALCAEWDASVARVDFLRDIGGQSVVWHVQKHKTWTANARDAVLVQTAYTSPTSIHLFSFSIDDDPSVAWIPKPSVSTIRTQVDLRGWSIEALDPKTVQVTLIEQSDPGGWMSKSVVPAQMVTQLAGMGEYTIKHGGPPVVTRLLHAQVESMQYEHATSTYTLTYRRDTDQDAPVESDIRCNMDVWGPNLDVVVSPPPSNATCLRRHPLAHAGGGLWLTIEHSAAALEHAVRIVVRKGPRHTKETGVVLLNGQRTPVDVDELGAVQREEKRRKRVRPPRILLDVHTSPHAVEHAPDAAPRAQPIEQPLVPMQRALDALLVLRRINSERPPDATGVPAGWTLVSERNGLFIRRKRIEHLSSSVAVQRADKVVQGVPAEELLHLVSNTASRHLWDERMSNATLLESYGSGATTSCWTSKGTYLFWPRTFLVASLAASGAQPVPASPSDALSPSSSHQPVYFYASASCDDARFDMEKINPHKHPVGRVLIDGWIFETIDPYSSASYAIPSTRCTHVVAIDYGGSLPPAMNAMWNATLPQAVQQLEAYLQAQGPPPYCCAPPAWMHVLGDGHDDDRSLIWSLRRPKHTALLLMSEFHAAQRTLHVLALVPRQDIAEMQTLSPLQLQAASPKSPTPRIKHPASTRSLAKEAHAPIYLVDMQIELQHYPHGYAISVTWDRAQDAPPDAPVPDWYDLSKTPTTLPDASLPLSVSVLDLPPSALQAATRSSVDRFHKHLVRVALPGLGTRHGTWHDELQRRGVALRIALFPLDPDRPHTGANAALDTGQVPVTCNGNVAEIVYGDEAARAMPSLDTHSHVVDQLERIPRPNTAVPSTPRPVAPGCTSTVGAHVLMHPLATDVTKKPCAGNEERAAHEPSAAQPSASACADDAPPPHTPGPIFGLLRQPLRRTTDGSRLNSTLSSMGQLVSRGGDAGEQKSARLSLSAQHAPDSAPLSSAAHAQGYRCSTLLLVAVLAFLLGSLVRTFVQPADFLVVPQSPHESETVLAPHRGVIDSALREMDSLVQAARNLPIFPGGHAEPVQEAVRRRDLLQSHNGILNWRKIFRFFDVPLVGGWTAMVALVRRE